eukprot:5576778-Prymnesium_polylepis.1
MEAQNRQLSVESEAMKEAQADAVRKLAASVRPPRARPTGSPLACSLGPSPPVLSSRPPPLAHP